jgi:hypothetical protein
MANNVAVTAGSGTTVATDDVSDVHYQVVKLALGDEGVTTRVTATDGLPVEIVAGTVALSGEDHIGAVGGHTVVIRPSITVTAGAYTAADVAGGELTLTSALRTSNGSGVLQDILITTEDGEAFQCNILIFSASPASNLADNAAFSWGSGDHDILLGKVEFVTADYETLGADGVAHKQNLGIGVKGTGGDANLHALIIATDGITFGATTDLNVAFKFLQD